MLRPFAFMGNDNVAGVGPQTSVPYLDATSPDDWNRSTGLFAAALIDEDPYDQSDYIHSGNITAARSQAVEMTNLASPDDHTQTKIHVRYRRVPNTAGVTLRIALHGYEWTKAVEQDGVWRTWIITLTEAQSQNLYYGSPETVTITKDASTYTRTIQVAALKITTEQ